MTESGDGNVYIKAQAYDGVIGSLGNNLVIRRRKSHPGKQPSSALQFPIAGFPCTLSRMRKWTFKLSAEREKYVARRGKWPRAIIQYERVALNISAGPGSMHVHVYVSCDRINRRRK
jgi:hypothetical protein